VDDEVDGVPLSVAVVLARGVRVPVVELSARLTVTASGGAVGAEDLAAFRRRHGVSLPEALAGFYRSVGVGALDDFLRFVAPQHMISHRELVGHLLDEEGERLIEPTADVIVFAQSDNGDMCGWHAAALAAGTDRVVRLEGFRESPLTGSTREFLEGLLDVDYFGLDETLAPVYELDELPSA
jgi:hypothetical protein